MSQDVPPPGSSGLAIGTASARFALEPHPYVDLSTLFAADGAPAGCVAEIVPAEGGLALRNIGTVSWAVTLAGGPTHPVGPGEEVPASAGTTLLLGAAILGIGTY